MGDLNTFATYCWSFYGADSDLYPQKWSMHLIYAACLIRSNMKEYGDGDSIDREWVRDLLINTVGE